MRNLMYQHIQGYNKHLTRDYLDQFSYEELLGLCHPVDRLDFKRQLDRLELI